jgi:putative RNA 2'-phosphotransferase
MEESKMDNKRMVKISKFLSLVLRHKPEVIGLTIDENGWADVRQLMKKSTISFDFNELKYVVDSNDKKRFVFSSDFCEIRAAQGHSIDVDLDLKEIIPNDIVYHGTSTDRVSSILKSGINKGKRHAVHLSKDENTAGNVGKRHGKLVILSIDAKKMIIDGHHFFESDNGVILIDFVPSEYITVLSYEEIQGQEGQE